MKALQVVVSVLLIFSFPRCTSFLPIQSNSEKVWSEEEWKEACLEHRFSKKGFFPATRGLSNQVSQEWWIPLSRKWINGKTNIEDKRILEEFYYSLGSQDTLRQTLAAHPYWMERLIEMALEIHH